MDASILTFITGFLMAAAAIISALAARQKGQGDFSKSIADASAAMVGPLTKRVETLESESETQRQEIANLKTENTFLKARLQVFEGGVALLVNQIRSLGHTPYWTPPDAKDLRAP